MTLQTDLERILALAQREVECPKCGGKGQRTGGLYGLMIEACEHCGGRNGEVDMTKGTGQVPDPRFKGLVEALREPCAGCDGSCGGTGRALRPWDTRPQGALGGVILCHVEAAAGEALLSGDGNIYYPLRDLGAAIARTFQGPDCDSLIVKLVLEYLERTKEATHATE